MQKKPSYDQLLKRTRELEAREKTVDAPAPACCSDREGLLDKSGQHFRDLVDNSPTGISIVQDGTVVYRNPEQLRIFGPLTEGHQQSIFDRIHPADSDKLSDLLQSALSGTAMHAGMDLRFIRLSGETTGELAMKWLHCRTSLIEHEGRPAVLINMMDITRDREMKRLLSAKDRMSSLGRVAAGIAHEIRNHLSAINIYLDSAEQALGKNEDRESLGEVFENIQTASSKIEAVIKRVMDFSKPSEPRLTPIDINRPIEDALGLSSVMLRKTGIEIVKDLAEGLPRCLADYQLMEQVILNLIMNASEAMKIMEAGKQIRVRSSPNGGGFVVVSVADSGPGVPSDLAGKIFNPFFTTKKSSTGIGLSLCQRIIHDHGGVLKVSSSVMGGAEFSFTIPVNI